MRLYFTISKWICRTDTTPRRSSSVRSCVSPLLPMATSAFFTSSYPREQSKIGTYTNTDTDARVNLNGSIIANLGFTRKIGFPNAQGKYALNANYTSLWGAVQSLGQLLAMIFINPISDRVGRKYTLYSLWVVLCAVSLF